MKVSREQTAENRRNILDAAAALFRARGFEAVTVAEVMKAAGLTHGGFYGHFKSKDELIARTMEHALRNAATQPTLLDYAHTYLSPAHRDNPALGCAVSALGSEAGRQSAQTRAVMTGGLDRQIERLSETAPGADEAERRRAATGAWAALVGAMTLARTADDPALSDRVLADTLAWLEERLDGRPSA